MNCTYTVCACAIIELRDQLNVRGGQHVVGVLPHAVEKRAHLAVFALFVKARSSSILFESLLPLGPVVGLSEVEGLGRV